MAETKIQWTEQTWNPIVGCTVATPGCTNCYAMKIAWRMGHNSKTPQYHGLTKKVNGNAVWTGKMNLVEKALMQPLKRKKPTMYFVNSMGDLFHENVPDEWIDRVFAVMALCPQHTFQVLTKRADRMREYMGGNRNDTDHVTERLGCTIESMMADESLAYPAHWFMTASSLKNGSCGGAFPRPDLWPLPNAWLGVSVEDQTRADERIPLLLETPAAVRFVSAEPLLGPVDLPMPLGCSNCNHQGNCHPRDCTICGSTGQEPTIDWVIVGGESGPKARPMHPDWARRLRDQCVEAGVPFFFKQWGEWIPSDQKVNFKYSSVILTAVEAFDWGDAGECEILHDFDAASEVYAMPVGKKAAGNLLNGDEWQQMPVVSV